MIKSKLIKILNTCYIYILNYVNHLFVNYDKIFSYFLQTQQKPQQRQNYMFDNNQSPSQKTIPNTIKPPFSKQKRLDSSLFQKYADASLETQSESTQNIQISIDGNLTRSGFMSYVVYHIFGRDKNGPIDVYRRFNQFYKMRTALIKRFPGCFVPSIPEKSISLVDAQIINKRQRYLNYFVRRMAKLPHLYNSEEFQALLRSTERDLGGTFEKWPQPTATDIINRYKNNFSFLSGKVIDSLVKESIKDFIRIIERTSVYMYRFKIHVKQLAMARNQFDKALSPFLSKSLPNFEKQCIAECAFYDKELIYSTLGQRFEQIKRKVVESLQRNPYWLVYDLVKREQRDGVAFLECTKSIQEYQRKGMQLQIKISENNKAISEVSLGKRSNSQLKYKLQVQNQELKREKQSIQSLTDIITAIVVFVEMVKFKEQKRWFYLTVMMKLGGYEFSQLQSIHQMWTQLEMRSQAILAKIQPQ